MSDTGTVEPGGFPTLEQFQTVSIDDLAEATGIHPEVLELMRSTRERDAIHEENEPTVTSPCPPWCQYSTGHRYDSVLADDLTYTRYHASIADESALARVMQEERNRGGQVSLLPAFVDVIGGDGEELAAAVARERATAMLRAADDLDQICRADATMTL